MRTQSRLFTVHQEDSERIDRYLTCFNEDLSRTFLQNLIKEGLVTVNKRKVKPSYRVRGGDKIELVIPKPQKIELVPQPIPLNIIFEDDMIVVVDKPPGLVVHPAPGHPDGTLVNALLYHCRNLGGIGGKLRPGIVHRLDRDTSGVMVVAKTGAAHCHLVQAFKNREVCKAYIALVAGEPPHTEAEIDAPIGRHPEQRKKMAVIGGTGRPAWTFYRVLANKNGVSFVLLLPRTGRTHQLRVHMAYLGCPIIGDHIYGGRRLGVMAPRQMLHSLLIRFEHPQTRESITWRAEPARDFKQKMEELGLDTNLFLTNTGCIDNIF